MAANLLRFLRLPLMSLAFGLGACAGDGWQKSADRRFEYRLWAARTDAPKIDYGDSIILDFKLLHGSAVLMNTFDNGGAARLCVPTKMHRNLFEEGLTLASAGDSLEIRTRYAEVESIVKGIAIGAKPDDEIRFVYKIHRVRPRAEIEAERRARFAQEQHLSVEELAAEVAEKQAQASERAQFLTRWCEDYQLGKVGLSPNTETEGLEIWEIVQGQGAPKTSGDTAFIYYITLVEPTRQVFDNAFARGARLAVAVDQNPKLIAGFHQIVKRLRVGSRAVVRISPELGYGERGSLPVVPKAAALWMYVELAE